MHLLDLHEDPLGHRAQVCYLGSHGAQVCYLGSQGPGMLPWVTGPRYATLGHMEPRYATLGHRAQVCYLGSQGPGMLPWVTWPRYATLGHRAYLLVINKRDTHVCVHEKLVSACQWEVRIRWAVQSSQECCWLLLGDLLDLLMCTDTIYGDSYTVMYDTIHGDSYTVLYDTIYGDIIQNIYYV